LRLECSELEHELSEIGVEREDGTQWRTRPTTVSQALSRGLFQAIGVDARLRMKHTVRAYDHDAVITLTAVEDVGSTTVEGELTTSFSLKLELDGGSVLVQDPEDFYYILYNLARDHGVFMRMCGYCAFAATQGYGGDDWRYGLYCLRDTPDPSVLRNNPDRLQWEEYSWSNVDAFHWCPSFTLAEVFQALMKERGKNHPD
jgi:hypothetical protein